MPKPIREMSEEEQMARLLRVSPDEIEKAIPAQELMLNSLKTSIGKPSAKAMSEIAGELDQREGGAPSRQREESAEVNKTVDYNTEKVLLKMFDIYDSLVEMFQRVGLSADISDELTKQIWQMEECIEDIGGSVDHFVPENFVSGLAAPDSTETAQKVIDTTLKCYKLGKIKNAVVDEGGSTIRLDFVGVQGDIEFLAKGEISPKGIGWTGNEAIDYLYKDNGGKMTVRAYEKGKWANKSDDYNIHWELTVTDLRALDVEVPDNANDDVNDAEENIPDFAIQDKEDEIMKD